MLVLQGLGQGFSGIVGEDTEIIHVLSSWNTPWAPPGPQKIDPGPLGSLKSGLAPPGDSIFTDFQLPGSILMDFRGF